jgi:hypothetical protein
MILLIGRTEFAVGIDNDRVDFLRCFALRRQSPHILGDIDAQAATESMIVEHDAAIGLSFFDVAGEVAGVSHSAAATVAGHILQGIGIGHRELIGFAHAQGCALHLGRQGGDAGHIRRICG